VRWCENTSGGRLIKPEAFTISLQKARIQWQCESDETLLMSALRQGIELPSSCQNGTCRTCLLQSNSTRHTYRIEWPGLSAQEKASGMTLSCVATPAENMCIDDSHWAPERSAGAFHVRTRDPFFLVLDKPSGLLSVPGKGPSKSDCLSTRVQRIYPDALVVHRLDQATSGLMIMALGASAQTQLGHLFSQSKVQKTYLAKVQGHMPLSDWETIDAPIYADWAQRPKRCVDPRGKDSQTRYRCLQSNGQVSLLEVAPLSGRTHQIRVHLSHLGYPILGDTLYASEKVASLSPRLLLHAHTLAFVHPFTEQPITVKSNLPVEFLSL
jgi:tRNA pseudouridine32 synthase / 23S rRNA pseudouridine746 synthase